MFPARPQAAKQETSRQRGSTMPGYRKPRLAVSSRTGAFAAAAAVAHKIRDTGYGQHAPAEEG